MPSSTSQIMKLSRNGQVSLPADTRRRWDTERILVVDLGDYVVMRPASDDPVAALYGKDAGPGPTAEQARAAARAEETAVERRRSAG